MHLLEYSAIVEVGQDKVKETALLHMAGSRNQHPSDDQRGTTAVPFYSKHKWIPHHLWSYTAFLTALRHSEVVITLHRATATQNGMSATVRP